MGKKLLKSYLKDNRNVFLTGPGGSGKSFHILKLAIEYPHLVITSTTGISTNTLLLVAAAGLGIYFFTKKKRR